MSATPLDRVHPVTRLAHQLGDRLSEIGQLPRWTMTPDEHRSTLVDLARARAQLDALYLQELADADAAGVGDEVAARSAADWVAVETRQVHRETRADLKLAKTLAGLPRLAQAYAEGGVNTAQTRAIVSALDLLPAETTTAEVAKAEAHLVELAAEHDAKALALLGRRLFEVIAPEEADRREGEQLEREEAFAARKLSFTMRPGGDGTVYGWFRIPTLHAEMAGKMMLAFYDREKRAEPTRVQRGRAFCELIESVHAKQLPKKGGCGATIVVTMTLEQLLGRFGAADLDTGGKISAGEARRLACTAGIIPVVLGGKSQILDAGRKRRFHTELQRILIGVRDGGCTAEGCDLPPALCHLHHQISWTLEGDTDIDGALMLCPHHHRRIHDARYNVRYLPGGKVAFHRRT